MKLTTSTMAVLPRWTLAARDAFNGIVLWEKAINQWEEYLRNFRTGPVHLPRSLVVADGRLYTFLGYDEPLVALDPASGRKQKCELLDSSSCAQFLGRRLLRLRRRSQTWS